MACSCVPLLLVLQPWKHSDSSTETRDRTLNTQFHEIALLAQIEPGHGNFPTPFPFRFNPFQPSKPELLSLACYTSAGSPYDTRPSPPHNSHRPPRPRRPLVHKLDSASYFSNSSRSSPTIKAPYPASGNRNNSAR